MKLTASHRVALVGRTNVGKSTLFNRLSDNVKSMTYDYHGVTRDLVIETISWQGKVFELIDTGGINFKKTSDSIAQQTRTKAEQAIQDADVLVLVCDGVAGLVQEEVTLARQLHKMGKKVLVAVNKSDDKRVIEQLHEFDRLGFSHVVPISAQHGRGIGELLDLIVAALPETATRQAAPPAFKIVVLGKPNVGKSSLINAVLNEERFIVADQPGTTREAIGQTIRFYQEDILITDTPGIRKKRAVQEPLESLMVKSSLHAVQEADIVVLVLDASAGMVVDQELKLAFYVFEQQHKALLIVLNKQDKTDEVLTQALKESFAPYKHLIDKVPMLSTSCVTGKNIGKVIPMIKQLWSRCTQEIPDDELTILLKNALTRKPLYKNQQLLTLKRACQLRNTPPTIVLRVDQQAHLFGPTQCAYLERVVRDTYDLQGVPIKFLVKNVKNVSA